MQKIITLRKLEVIALYFEAANDNDDYHCSITIFNGEIDKIESWGTHGFYNKKKGDSGFAESCYDAIRFIVDHKPTELKNIYNALSEGEMKDFCRKIQAEKIAELQF